MLGLGIALVVVTAVAVMAVVSVEAWMVRALWRTRLACELERQRHAAALEEVSRHRDRMARELDAALSRQTPTAPGSEAGSVLQLPGTGDRGAAA